jgi:hypothetical protein
MFNPRQTLRSLVAAGALSVISITSAAAAETYQADWRFEVLLNDKPIGFHSFSLTGQGERQTLTTEAQFDVKFLFINAFRYRHDNTETWGNGCLDSINATTDSNGDFLSVRGQRFENSFRLEAGPAEPLRGECIRTFAYWNPDILDSSRLLNSQTGELEEVTFNRESLDIVIINGKSVEAIRYRLLAESGAITLWYSNDESRRWLALEAPAKGGRTLRYIPVRIPDADDLLA